jgi:hypothetical protein
MLSQNGMFWFFFIQFYYAVSHTEHRWRCSYTSIGFNYHYISYVFLTLHEPNADVHKSITKPTISTS